ncbi:berberine bridge enzyme-like 18 isoform X2 [Hibiscus syriacus]|uniref:berberine bridge enzyme-like 18 isoform X2 n=1 Tax=Hibiscus syriacus TaxID=106335 RepID=UPI001924E3F8|nr:berberine bridge enzyme-like 18 isoform X2 [Hibiscus syriacus]
MKPPQFSMLIPLVLAALFSFSLAALPHENFLHCLSLRSNDSSISRVIFTRTNSSYESVLEGRLWNLRFNTTDTPKPLVIVTPTQISHIQATIYCSRKHGLQTRTRSGGHDYEGLSFVSRVTFVVIDLVNFRSVDVDVENKVAWVQSGATLGELYYRIAEKSRTLSFPAAFVHTIGVGGHISGGGVGLLIRKYGTAGDNVVDAQFIDVKGRILDRKTMGEDLFWAIRGGGGGSFGIVLAWKLSLVPVPANVTVFSVTRTLEQNATQLLHRWQYIAPNLPDDVYPAVIVRSINSTQDGRKTVLAAFNSLFLGTIDELLPLMKQRFPELGLTRQNCTEMSFVEALILNNGIQNQPLEILLNTTARVPIASPAYKVKADFVKDPIPETGLNGLFSRLTDDAAAMTILVFVPYGGIMDRIPENATPGWQEEDNIHSQRYLDWARRTYDYMTPFVSKSPRAAYINFRDLDIGSNNIGHTSYAQASIWGRKYFKNNFKKLARVKTMIDPENFFKHEQSIPPLY